jgi:hypothetical protein
MASQRFAHRMHGVDSAAERSLRAQLAHNIALRVVALREARAAIDTAATVDAARAAVEAQIAGREQQASASAMGVGHA